MRKMHEKSFDIIEAVEKGDWNVIDQFVAEGGDINASLMKTGPQAGYTALHFATLNEIYRLDREISEKWIKTYRANVNCVGADGAQPIHLACLKRNFATTGILLDYGADANAEFTKELVEKYQSFGDWKWSDEFSKMTLVVFFTINPYIEMLSILYQYKVNVEIIGKNNKTLLMYGAELASKVHLSLFTRDNAKCKPEFINARDDYGRHAVHYLLPNEEFGEFRYSKPTTIIYLLWELRQAEADINAMIDNDPDTLLLNKVAYRCDYCTLKDLLELKYPIPAKGRPLHYFMIPVDPEKFVEDSNYRNEVEHERNKCLKLILENYTLRREFGVFVPEEEIKLMDQLIPKKIEIKKIVEDIKKDFINKCLTEHFSDSLTLYDLAIKVFDKKSLKLLVKDDQFVKNYDNFFDISKIRREYDQFYLLQAMDLKIQHAHKRKKIMDEVEKISQLKKVIPLPYEVILIIIEYVDNYDLKNFVNSFYESPVCE